MENNFLKKIIIKRFAQHKWNYVWQSSLAGIFVVVTLVVLGSFEKVGLLGFIGTSSLGSSAFLVFSSPHSESASIRRMWGGYIISFIMGALFSTILFSLTKFHFDMKTYFGMEICAALAMAMTMFFMAILHFEHPPAAGLALGLVVEPWTKLTLTVIFITVIAMTATKHLLRPWLIDLI